VALKRQQKPEWLCRKCPSGRGSLCGALMRGETEEQCPVRQISHSAAPDEVIYSRQAPADDVFAVCQGWALRFVQLSDGRRQNLAVLLPGDLCIAALFHERLHFSVEAITELRITRFSCADVKKRVLGNARMLELLGKACAAEQRDIDERAVDLGRRTAEERVMGLMLSLVNRISGHRLLPNQHHAFPLLQRHIADLTGLTHVHVSRVMAEFRNAGIMTLSKGLLTIANPTEVEKIARLT